MSSSDDRPYTIIFLCTDGKGATLGQVFAATLPPSTIVTELLTNAVSKMTMDSTINVPSVVNHISLWKIKPHVFVPADGTESSPVYQKIIKQLDDKCAEVEELKTGTRALARCWTRKEMAQDLDNLRIHLLIKLPSSPAEKSTAPKGERIPSSGVRLSLDGMILVWPRIYLELATKVCITVPKSYKDSKAFRKKHLSDSLNNLVLPTSRNEQQNSGTGPSVPNRVRELAREIIEGSLEAKPWQVRLL